MKNSEDHFFKSILAESELEITSDDFEDEVMEQIVKERKHKKAFSSKLKLSWLFFIVAVIVGVLILSQWPIGTFSIGNINSNFVYLTFEFIFVLFVLLQFDSLLTFSKKHTVS